MWEIRLVSKGATSAMRFLFRNASAHSGFVSKTAE